MPTAPRAVNLFQSDLPRVGAEPGASGEGAQRLRLDVLVGVLGQDRYRAQNAVEEIDAVGGKIDGDLVFAGDLVGARIAEYPRANRLQLRAIGLVQHDVPREFDVGCGEFLARVPFHALAQGHHPVLAVVGHGVAGRQCRCERLVLPAAIFVETIVGGAEGVRIAVADRVHRDERAERLPRGEGRRGIRPAAFDRPMLGLRIERRRVGGGVEAGELRVHRDHVLRIEQDRHRLDVVPALLEIAIGLLPVGVAQAVGDGQQRAVDFLVVDIIEILAVGRHLRAAEQRVWRRLDGGVEVALEIAVPAAIDMGLAVALPAPRRDHRERHEARHHIDTDQRHLRRRQRAPHHACRLVVGDHHVELEERRRGLCPSRYRGERGGKRGLQNAATAGGEFRGLSAHE